MMLTLTPARGRSIRRPLHTTVGGRTCKCGLCHGLLETDVEAGGWRPAARGVRLWWHARPTPHRGHSSRVGWSSGVATLLGGWWVVGTGGGGGGGVGGGGGGGGGGGEMTKPGIPCYQTRVSKYCKTARIIGPSSSSRLSRDRQGSPTRSSIRSTIAKQAIVVRFVCTVVQLKRTEV